MGFALTHPLRAHPRRRAPGEPRRPRPARWPNYLGAVITGVALRTSAF